jgi:hypothetical protein
MLHERHTEHTFLFLVLWINRRRRRRGWRRTPDETGLRHHLDRWSGNNFSFGRRDSRLIVFHAELLFLRLSGTEVSHSGIDGLRLAGLADRLPGGMLRAAILAGPRYGSIDLNFG